MHSFEVSIETFDIKMQQLERTTKRAEQDKKTLKSSFQTQLDTVHTECQNIVESSVANLDSELNQLKLQISTLKNNNKQKDVKNSELKAKVDDCTLQLSRQASEIESLKREMAEAKKEREEQQGEFLDVLITTESEICSRIYNDHLRL